MWWGLGGWRAGVAGGGATRQGAERCGRGRSLSGKKLYVIDGRGAVRAWAQQRRGRQAAASGATAAHMAGTEPSRFWSSALAQLSRPEQ